MPSLQELERKVAAIERRNKSVEEDKAWETSYARKAVLAALTYLAIGIYFSAISISSPWLNAIVPAVAFMLSTLSLPFLKKLWLERFYKKK